MSEGLSIGLRSERKLAEVTAKLAEHGITFDAPEITFDLKGHTVGQAVGKSLIRLNLQAIGDPRYTEDMFENTLPHEIAHIVVEQLWPNEPSHGSKWRWIMSLIGVPAQRLHDYETVSSRTVARPYEYRCNCMTHKVTATLHRRIQQGKPYYCRKCRGRLR